MSGRATQFISKSLLVVLCLVGIFACQANYRKGGTSQEGWSPEELAAIKDDCQSFDLQATRVLRVAGRWQIVVGKQGLIDFGNRKSEALEALSILQRYNLNQACRFDKSSSTFQYFLTSGKAPHTQERCVSFTPESLSIRKQATQWTVGEKGAPHLQVAQNAKEAKKTQGILMKHQFTQKCSIGGSRPSFQYFR